MLPAADDAIFALASPVGLVSAPVGRPGRAVVRISGPNDLWPLLDGLLASPLLRRRGTQRIRIRLSPTGAELPALAVAFPGPRSFTGQDTVELLVSSNPSVVDRVLLTLSRLPGLRPAEPGEFAARAFVSGRLTLAQAEGIAALIRAVDDRQIAAAHRVMSGGAEAEHRSIADELASLLALVEAGIDFTDQEDVVPIATDALRSRLSGLRARVESMLPGGGTRRSLDHLPVAVLVGRPNAGKSALFNALLGRPRSVVADLAGTTRDVVREELRLRELGDPAAWESGPATDRCELCDLAGLEADLPDRDATATEPPDRAIDRQARVLALRAIAAADVLLWCDPTGRFDEGELASWLREASAASRATDARPTSGSRDSKATLTAPAVLRVRTKADLPSAASAGALDPSKSSSQHPLPVSAIDRRNLGTLRLAIADAIARPGSADPTAAVTAVARHARALADALAEIDAALASLSESPSAAGPLRAPELIAGRLRAGLDRLGELTGQIPPDEIIGRVFATFCVGK